MAAGSLEVLPVPVDGPIGPGFDIAGAVSAAGPRDGDVAVVSQKAVSKAEGRIVRLGGVRPSGLAEGIASEYGKDPRIVHLVLEESGRIVRMARGILIVETRSGIVCANAGVDESDVELGHATLLPEDPDASARRISEGIGRAAGRDVAVVVSDTFGRPFRAGQTDCAIGVHGISPLLDYAGRRDSVGRELRVTEIAAADELCSAAELVMGKSLGIPAALVRGYRGGPGTGSARDLLRPAPEDLFRD